MVAAGSEAPGYIRGGGGVEIRPRSLAAALAVVALVTLGVSALVLGVSDARHNAEVSRMHAAVPVVAQVTGCVGVSSGVGQDIQYWDCRASFSLSGHRYEEQVRASRLRLPVGRPLSAVATAGHPPALYLPGAVGAARPYWLPAGLGGLAIVAGVIVCVLWVRARRIAR